MRKLALSLSICAAAALPGAALSQDQAPPRTTQDYVCAFAGECVEEAPAEEPQADDPYRPAGTPRVSASRGFSLSRPGTRPSSRSPRPRATARASAPRRPVAAEGQRLNLLLNFETGSAKLTAAAEAEARVFAQSLMLPQLVNMHFRIEGHTDSVGSRAMNLTLSQRRAQSVADFLVGLGVARDRLEVTGFGPDRPLPGTRASAGQNRRVEAVRTS